MIKRPEPLLDAEAVLSLCDTAFPSLHATAFPFLRATAFLSLKATAFPSLRVNSFRKPSQLFPHSFVLSGLRSSVIFR